MTGPSKKSVWAKQKWLCLAQARFLPELLFAFKKVLKQKFCLSQAYIFEQGLKVAWIMIETKHQKLVFSHILTEYKIYILEMYTKFNM